MPQNFVGSVLIGLTAEPAAETPTESSLQRQQQGDSVKVLKSATRNSAPLIMKWHLPFPLLFGL